MFGMSSPVVTLSLEPDGARLLKISGKKVEWWRSVTFTEEKVSDITTVDTAALAEVLKDLFRPVKSQKDEVLLGITAIRSVYRIATVPDIKSLKLEEAVKWVAAREIPLKLEDVKLTWYELGKTGQERRIFLLATPKKILDSVNSVMDRASIRYKSADLKPLALARFINTTDAIIIDIEEGSTTMVVIGNGEPRVMHTIIVNRGLPVADRVQRISSDLLRTVQFYNNSHPEDQIDSSTQAFITGKLAVAPDMIKLMQQSIPYTLGTPAQCLEYPDDFPVYEYAVNIGLALREKNLVKGNREYGDGGCTVIVDIMSDD